MSRYKRLPVEDLIVDDRYQRELDEKRVTRIAEDFDPDLFGVLDVSVRNGKSAVFDGQHRLAAARLLGHDKVPCLVHDIDVQREAELFVALQKQRKSVHPVAQIKAERFAGVPEACAIGEIVEANGFKLAAYSGNEAGQARAISAVGAVRRVYRNGNLGETLQALETLWGGDYKSTDGKLIEGLSLLLVGYGHRMTDDVIQKLKDVPPVDILRRAAGTRLSLGGNPQKLGRIVYEELRRTTGLRGAPRKAVEVEA
jgi:hypothetical protein